MKNFRSAFFLVIGVGLSLPTASAYSADNDFRFLRETSSEGSVHDFAMFVHHRHLKFKRKLIHSSFREDSEIRINDSSSKRLLALPWKPKDGTFIRLQIVGLPDGTQGKVGYEIQSHSLQRGLMETLIVALADKSATVSISAETMQTAPDNVVDLRSGYFEKKIIDPNKVSIEMKDGRKLTLDQYSALIPAYSEKYAQEAELFYARKELQDLQKSIGKIVLPESRIAWTNQVQALKKRIIELDPPPTNAAPASARSTRSFWAGVWEQAGNPRVNRQPSYQP